VSEALKKDPDRISYRFTRVVTLGDADPGAPGQNLPLPANGGYIYPMDVNSDGTVLFDAWTATGEGVFTWHRGHLRPIFRSGEAAPGGKVFGGFGSMGHVALDEDGDIFAPFTLEPVPAPLGVGGGAFFYDADKRSLRAIALPDVTAVPRVGGTLQGVYFNGSMSDRHHIAFGGIYAAQGTAMPYSLGIFSADARGNLAAVALPGDAAPGGGTFDQAWDSTINEHGEVAFGGHVAGEECVGQTPGVLSCYESLYLKDRRGRLISIAHQGAPAAGGGTYRAAWGGKIDHHGNILFTGDLTPAPDVAVSQGLFLYSGGTVRPVVRPGDAMPGGGTLASTTNNPDNFNLNNEGEIVFAASLDSGAGIYWHRHGVTRLIVRFGDTLPGIGKVTNFGYFGVLPAPHISDDGSIIVGLALESGEEVLVYGER
jgi:hypothetical protein